MFKVTIAFELDMEKLDALMDICNKIGKDREQVLCELIDEYIAKQKTSNVEVNKTEAEEKFLLGHKWEKVTIEDGCTAWHYPYSLRKNWPYDFRNYKQQYWDRKDAIAFQKRILSPTIKCKTIGGTKGKGEGQYDLLRVPTFDPLHTS